MHRAHRAPDVYVTCAAHMRASLRAYMRCSSRHTACLCASLLYVAPSSRVACASASSADAARAHALQVIAICASRESEMSAHQDIVVDSAAACRRSPPILSHVPLIITPAIPAITFPLHLPLRRGFS